MEAPPEVRSIPVITGEQDNTREWITDGEQAVAAVELSLLSPPPAAPETPAGH
jgi:hypothetical protein